MKKFSIVIFILALILASCSTKEQEKKLTNDELLSKIQQRIKKTESLTLHSENETIAMYDKFTTKFTQTTDSEYDSINESALKIDAKSNHAKYDVKSVIFNLDNGDVTTYPKAKYLNYRARKADNDYFSGVQSQIVNITHLLQDVVKPTIDNVKQQENGLTYQGKSRALLALYQYGFHQSSMNQIEVFNDITDLRVENGSYDITYNAQYEPETMSFKLKVSGKHVNKPVQILMEQTTDYSKLNETNVQMYSEE